MIRGMRRASGHLTRKLEETYIKLSEVCGRGPRPKPKEGLMTDRD